MGEEMDPIQRKKILDEHDPEKLADKLEEESDQMRDEKWSRNIEHAQPGQETPFPIEPRDDRHRNK